MTYVAEFLFALLLIMTGAGILRRHAPSRRQRRLAAVADGINAGSIDATEIGWCRECCRSTVIVIEHGGLRHGAFCDHPIDIEG